MDIGQSLYNGVLIRLGPIDYENDAPLESKWPHDAEYLRFAFTELNLRRVTLDVFEYNPRAMRSYEKAGFVVEGRMRGMLKREGKRWDLVFMGILRDEWERISEGTR